MVDMWLLLVWQIWFFQELMGQILGWKFTVNANMTIVLSNVTMLKMSMRQNDRYNCKNVTGVNVTISNESGVNVTMLQMSVWKISIIMFTVSQWQS